MNAYILIKCTEEERHLLDEEMKSVLLYCMQRKECIVRQHDCIKNNESQYSKGIIIIIIIIIIINEHTSAGAEDT